MNAPSTRRVLLSPSILTADFGRIADEIASVAPFVDWFHLDVMDGHFVPNLSFGPPVVAAVRRACDLPLHVHLMISDPGAYADMFAAAGANRISFHPEVTSHPGDVVGAIRALGLGAGMAIHPDVGVDVASPHLDELEVLLVMTVRPGFGGQPFLAETVPKIAAARSLLEGHPGVAVEVDGGVNETTAADVVAAGADIVVAGSAVFDGVDPPSAARRMRERLRQLARQRGGS
jgi:ribulose-phosphate 3-epimerase